MPRKKAEQLTLRCQKRYTYLLAERHMEDNYYGERVSRLGLARAIQKARKDENGEAAIPGSYVVFLEGRGLSIGCRWFPPAKAKKVMAWAAAGARAHARRKAKQRR